MSASVLPQSNLDLGATRTRLEQLERGEWFRWSVALALPVLLTLGLLVLSMPVRPRGIFDQGQLDIAVRALLGLILLYDTFAVYQQVLLTRLRHQLTSQLGLIAALDLIKYPEGEEGEEAAAVPKERRRMVRCHFGRELRVKTGHETKKEPGVQGRITDISEHGLGAVIPTSLPNGATVTLEFMADECPLSVKAVIRYSRGLRYGMEFIGLTDQDLAKLRQIRTEQLASND
jgi:hypothetical protein